MKALRILSIGSFFMAAAMVSVAQSKTETFKVSGNCGMCKSKIEKAAKEAGAKTADWNVETKDLTVTYKTSSTNTAKIQQKIAAVGYDNAGVKATTESYKKLHGCCQYDRESTDEANCCPEGSACCKDGKCTKEGHNMADCCKPGSDCCKDGKCTKEGHNLADCCKDGKCTKEGHNGSDCCKKSKE